MSYEDGWAAMNLEMPARVPRTEYSAANHWALVSAVTGINVSFDSPKDIQAKARKAFMLDWKFDFNWSTGIGRNEFGNMKTDMGHCVYADGGVDKRPIGAHPFTDPEQVLTFDPFEAFGVADHSALVERFNTMYARNRANLPEQVAMTGTYITLVSGFIDLFGWEMLLLSAGLDPRGFGDLANRYAAWFQQYMNALADCDADVIMVHDDMVLANGPIFNPDWYRQYIFPNYRKYFAPIIESGKKLMFTSDGDFTPFIDDMVGCGVNGFVMEPMTDMAYIAEKYGKTHVFVGNADTRILLYGTREAIRAEVERCMKIGKDCPGFFLAVGNHIPSNTPVESALYYNECYEEMCRR